MSTRVGPSSPAGRGSRPSPRTRSPAWLAEIRAGRPAVPSSPAWPAWRLNQSSAWSWSSSSCANAPGCRRRFIGSRTVLSRAAAEAAVRDVVVEHAVQGIAAVPPPSRPNGPARRRRCAAGRGTRTRPARSAPACGSGSVRAGPPPEVLGHGQPGDTLAAAYDDATAARVAAQQPEHAGAGGGEGPGTTRRRRPDLGAVTSPPSSSASRLTGSARSRRRSPASGKSGFSLARAATMASASGKRPHWSMSWCTAAGSAATGPGRGAGQQFPRAGLGQQSRPVRRAPPRRRPDHAVGCGWSR